MNIRVKVRNDYINNRKIKYTVNTKLNLYGYVGCKNDKDRQQLQRRINDINNLFG